MPLLVQVYTCLSERVGLRDHEQVLNVMLGKIGTNLKSFGACEEVVTLTLSLFQVLCTALCANFVYCCKSVTPSLPSSNTMQTSGTAACAARSCPTAYIRLLMVPFATPGQFRASVGALTSSSLLLHPLFVNGQGPASNHMSGKRPHKPHS